MNKKVLLAYTSKYGSTKEVAERVKKVMNANGLEVDLQHMKDVKSLDPYHAVVFSSPLYINHWRKDAHRFLERHQEALKTMPVAVFSLGPTKGETEEEWETVRNQLKNELERYPWLKPTNSIVFGGVYDPAKLRFPDTLLATLPASPLHDLPASDIRDWDQIEAWATEVAQSF